MTHEEIRRIVPGARTAVVCIHGIVGTPNHFRSFLPLVPRDWSLVCLRLPGHGGDVRAFGRSSLDAWRAYALGEVEAMVSTHDRVILVAHSMGTLFSIRAALTWPEKIKELFLLQIPLRVWVSPRAAWHSLCLCFGRRSPRDRGLAADCGVALDWRLWRYLSWIPRFWELLVEIGTIRRALPRLATPGTAYQSRHDELVLFSSCVDLADHGSLHTVKLMGSGHFGYSDPDTALLHRDFREMVAKYR